MAPQLKPATGWKPAPKPRNTLKGNIIILVETPMPASTESEIPPAMLFKAIPEATPRRDRNMEAEPILPIWYKISFVGQKYFREIWSILFLRK